MLPNKKKKLNAKKYLFLGLKIFLILIFFLTLPGLNIYQSPKIHLSALQLTNLPAPAPYPENMGRQVFPRVTAEGIVILDLPSEVILYEKNSRQKFPPASTTKIITSLVALEQYQPNQILTVKTVITEGRVMGLVSGERISAENLIYGALIHSGNDAAYALAENYPGGIPAFVDKMNQKITTLGLKDTHFTNPVGFEDPNHYTTAFDLAQISRIALNNEEVRKIIGTKIISVADENYTLFHTLENVNLLLGKIPGVSGVKTGYTPEAGEVLSTVVKRKEHEVLIILLKSNDRFGETESLINWVFNNFDWVNLQPTESPVVK